VSLQIILKNSSVVGKEPTASQLANGELALNYNADGPFITCKDSAGTIRRVAGVWISNTAPASPTPGEFWLDTNTNPTSLKIYKDDVDTWINTVGIPPASTTVAGLVELATNGETQTGTDALRAVTPASLQSKISDSTSTASATTIASSQAVKSASDVANAALPRAGGTVTGNLTVSGDLTVNGTTTTIDTTTLIVEDKNIEMGVVATPTDATADGGGITLKGATDKTINWVNATDAWTFSEHVNIANAKEYRIAGASVLNATTLRLNEATTTNPLKIEQNATEARIQTTATQPLILAGQDGVGSTSDIRFETRGIQRLRITSDGNVGIGTTSPSSLLNIKGNNAVLTIEDSDNVGNTSIAFASTLGTQSVIRTTSDSSGRLQFETGGSPRLAIDSSGNVGIGTTNPVDGKLEVFHTGFQVALKTSGATANLGIGMFSNGGFVGTRGNNGGAEDVLRFGTSGQERLRIDSAGRLLVGTSSSRAQAGLTGRIQLEGTNFNTSTLQIINNNNNDVNGSFITLGKTRGTAAGGTTIVQNSDKLGEIRFAGSDGTNLIQAASIIAQVDGTPGASDMPGRLLFGTTADGATSPTTRMIIKSDGNVGIGTTSPTARLDVAGSARIGAFNTQGFAPSNSSGGAYFSWNRSNGSAETNITNLFENAALSFEFLQKTGASTGNILYSMSSSSHVWRISNTECVRIDSSGNVGIGTESPGSLLGIRNDNTTTYNATDDGGQRGNTATILVANENGTTNTFSQLVFDTAGSNQSIARIAAIRTGTSTNDLAFVVEGSNTKREALRITGAGKVGIGTASPGSLLHLSSATGSASPTPTELRIATTTNAGDWSTSDPWGRISFYSSDVSDSGPKINAAIDTVAAASSGGLTKLDFKLAQLTTGALASRLTIAEDGNVGIGTTSPGIFAGDCNLAISGSGGARIGLNAIGRTYYIAGDSGSDRLEIGRRISSNTADSADIVLDGSGTFRVKGAGTAGVNDAVQLNGSAPANSLLLDADGRVLVGTSSALSFASPASTVNIQSFSANPNGLAIVSSTSNVTQDAGSSLVLARRSAAGPVTASGLLIGSLQYQGFDGTSYLNCASIDAVVDGAPGTGDMPGRLVFSTTADGATSPTARMTIKNDGKVGIGTTSPGTLLHLSSATGSASPTPTELRIATTTTANDWSLIDPWGRISFYSADPGGSGPKIHATIDCVSDASSGASSNLFFNTSRNSADTLTTRLMVEGDSGNVGIGTTSPDKSLHIQTGTGVTAAVRITGNDGASSYMDAFHTSNRAGLWSQGNVPLVFATNNFEQVRIDGSGRLLVGTPASRSNSIANPQFQVEGISTSSSSLSIFRNFSSDTDEAPAYLLLGRSGSSDIGGDIIVANNNRLGEIRFCAADGSGEILAASIYSEVDGTPGTNDMPGRLVFSTTPNNASIPTERMRINYAGNVLIGTESITINTTNYGTRIAGDAAPGYFATSYNTDGTSGTVADFFGNAGRFLIRGDGDCENTNNSYTGISDIKLKENIVDANSQWSDIKSIRVRNYNLKEETGYNTHKQIGLIAQELETVCPGLVKTCPDLDENHQDLGTVTKSVNYSVLYMKAVKALQEAMERIETLEQRLSDAGIA